MQPWETDSATPQAVGAVTARVALSQPRCRASGEEGVAAAGITGITADAHRRRALDMASVQRPGVIPAIGVLAMPDIHGLGVGVVPHESGGQLAAADAVADRPCAGSGVVVHEEQVR